jgi:hypothetical protein
MGMPSLDAIRPVIALPSSMLKPRVGLLSPWRSQTGFWFSNGGIGRSYGNGNLFNVQPKQSPRTWPTCADNSL